MQSVAITLHYCDQHNHHSESFLSILFLILLSFLLILLIFFTFIFFSFFFSFLFYTSHFYSSLFSISNSFFMLTYMVCRRLLLPLNILSVRAYVTCSGPVRALSEGREGTNRVLSVCACSPACLCVCEKERGGGRV